MSFQQFCLRWNNHQPNFISMFTTLLNTGSLVDVTLAAEGKQLHAHKIVLSACSVYFQTLFTANPSRHPIVILKDVSYADLRTMVDFMYYGEVNVSQEQLPQILETAKMLKIKGLTEMPEAQTINQPESAPAADTWEAPKRSPNNTSPTPNKKRRYRKTSTNTPAVIEQNKSFTVDRNFNGAAVENSITLSSLPPRKKAPLFVFKDDEENGAVDATIQQAPANRIRPLQKIKLVNSRIGMDPMNPDNISEEDLDETITINQTFESDISGQQGVIEIKRQDIPTTSMAIPIIDGRGKTLIRQSRVRRESETSEPALIRRASEPATVPATHPELKKHASHPPMNKQSTSTSFEAVYIAMGAAITTAKTTPGTQVGITRSDSASTSSTISIDQLSSEIANNTPRASHCPVMRTGPALSCNFCWNTFDECGRILRRKTKYHCPECRSNLCIVPCFHEYHASLHERGEQ